MNMDSNSSKYLSDLFCPRSHVLIAASVQGELGGIEREIKDRRTLEIGGREVIGGRLFDTPVRLVTTGPGQVNAVQALTAAIESSRPSLIIQTGCAGGFAQAGVDIGDIGIAAEEADAHLGIESGDENVVEELPFPITRHNDRDITNRYPICRHLAESAFRLVAADPPSKRARVFKGPFVTVSTITASDERARVLYDRFRACMETMEGAGAAFVAIHYGLPYLQIRAACNRVGKRRRHEWDLPLAFDHASRAVLKVMRDLKR